MQLDLAFAPPWEAEDVAVVVDVLRMTTTAAALFSRGLDELAVFAEVDAAREHARRFGSLLLGERGGVALPGFDGGNSPLELEANKVSGRQAILCTSNGSRAVEAAAGARELLLGSIVNAAAVARQAVQLANGSITLICAGTDGLPSLDDALGAGCIAREVMRLVPGAAASDAVIMAAELAASPKGLAVMLAMSHHAETLGALGFSADVEFAGLRDTLSVVPRRSASEPTRFRVDAAAGAQDADVTNLQATANRGN